MIFYTLPKKGKPIIKHPGFHNLFILPYIRGRLVFSELAARAVEEETFDFLAIDLPYFLNDKGLLNMILKLFPVVSSLYIKKNDFNSILFPFVPNDAGCISLSLARMKLIDFECIDDSNLFNYPEGSFFQPDLFLKDDYFVFSDGIEKYFSPLWEQMSNFWRYASYTQKWFAIYRASIVTRRLKKHLYQRKRILFICEYQLWWIVNQLLQRKIEEPQSLVFPQKDLDVALVVEDPYQLWAKGLLDDYPFINYKFCEVLQEGRISSFDKLEILNDVLFRLFSSKIDSEIGTPSTRSIITFVRYLKIRLISCQRVSPFPVNHLFEGARSCLGREFARELAKILLQYPYPVLVDKKYIPPIFLKIMPNLKILQGEIFEFSDVINSIPHYGYPFEKGDLFNDIQENRIFWANLAHPTITGKEIEIIEKERENSVRWAIPYDYEFHSWVCSSIRERIKKEADQFRVERFMGNIYDGVDWKYTIYSRAQGEKKAIYIKRKHDKIKKFNKLDNFTPIVFLFEEVDGNNRICTVHDSNISQRNIELQNKDFPFDSSPEPDMVYSIFYTTKAIEILDGKGHVVKELLTSIAFLFSGCSMGVERYERINSRAKKYQCRLDPQEDDELRDFSLSELGMAWAIKYAEEGIIILTYSGWKPSTKILRFAEEKGVKIIWLPLSILSTSVVRRLRYFHFISTPLKKFPENEKIIKRFLN